MAHPLSSRPKEETKWTDLVQALQARSSRASTGGQPSCSRALHSTASLRVQRWPQYVHYGHLVFLAVTVNTVPVTRELTECTRQCNTPTLISTPSRSRVDMGAQYVQIICLLSLFESLVHNMIGASRLLHGLVQWDCDYVHVPPPCLPLPQFCCTLLYHVRPQPCLPIHHDLEGFRPLSTSVAIVN